VTRNNPIIFGKLIVSHVIFISEDLAASRSFDYSFVWFRTIEEKRTLTGEKNDKYAQVTAIHFGKMTIGNVDEVDVARGACA